MALAGTWPRLGPGSRVAGKGCGGGTGTDLCPGHELQQQQTFREHGRARHRAVSAGCYFIRPAPDAPSTRISSSWFCTEDAEPREANPITEEKRGRLRQSALQPEPPTALPPARRLRPAHLILTRPARQASLSPFCRWGNRQAASE